MARRCGGVNRHPAGRVRRGPSRASARGRNPDVIPGQRHAGAGTGAGSHLGDGIGAIVTAWSLYLLLAAGAATMLLAAHALAAGPLAASQPGFTIVDPLTASLLGVFLFGEHIQTGPAALAGEALALAVVIAGATALSRSCLILGEDQHPACLDQPAVSRGTDTHDRKPVAAGRH